MGIRNPNNGVSNNIDITTLWCSLVFISCPLAKKFNINIEEIWEKSFSILRVDGCLG